MALQYNCSQQGGSSKDLIPRISVQSSSRGETEIALNFFSVWLFFLQQEKMTIERDVQLLYNIKSSAGKAGTSDCIVRTLRPFNLRNPKN